MKLASLVIALAGSAHAQDMIVNIYATPLPDTYVVGAEFFGSLPGNATSIGSIWADVGFDVFGDGASPIEFIAYNPAYDTSLGSPTLNDGLVGTFEGNTNDFFGTPDPSNPLFVAAFRFEGFTASMGLDLVGQNTALFLGDPANPFGTVLLYQDVFGTPGTLTFGTGFPGFNSVTLDQVPWIPTPGTLAIAPVVFFAARRRRT